MKDFDAWNELKKKIETGPTGEPFFPQAGEVWMCAVGRNIGFEQNGGGKNFSRPVLVIKKFNNQMFWSVPLSTKQKQYDFYHNFTDPDGMDVSVILAQMRLTSIKRFKRRIYEIPGDLLNEMKIRLREFLS
ncbi:MAG: type II toxin-antitoxin system PemK/MazF family toxin [Candidatus Sungbacteria bacterium]|nr:type II toxin-antitoxin system PemK/MazF family toxin [Candidatus Sungbacteria bacterium]